MRSLNHSNRADITDIRFLIGLAAINAALPLPDGAQKTILLNEAIAALRTILLQHPQLIRVRLELARAFFLKGDDALARQHFMRVLVGNPQKEIAANIRIFLGQIRARRKWSGYLSLSIEQNDNINSASEVETIYVFGLPFVIDEQSRPQSATGLLLSTGAEYQAKLTPQDRWRFGVDFVRAEYERVRHGFNAPLSIARRVDRRRSARVFVLNRGLTFLDLVRNSPSTAKVKPQIQRWTITNAHASAYDWCGNFNCISFKRNSSFTTRFNKSKQSHHTPDISECFA